MSHYPSTMTAKPSTSLIISTYNSVAWLAKVLESVFIQSSADFEIVIADDGSNPDTLTLLRACAARSPVKIVHVWQPDHGFQKCRILNKAIAVSSGHRLLFTDGDCVLPPHFVASHIEMARTGYFLTGAYFKLPLSVSERVTDEVIQNADVFSTSWMLAHGLKPSFKILKLIMPPAFARVANHLTPTKKTWNGHNSSCLRTEAIMVNGFNEEIQYGGQDVEFGTRLNHAGIRGRHLRFTTVPLHLHHGHSYVTPGMRERSMVKRMETIQQRRIRAPRGLDQWLQADGSVQLDACDRMHTLN